MKTLAVLESEPTAVAAALQAELFWSYESPEARQAGALAPERVALGYAAKRPRSPFPSSDFAATWRAIEAGYEVDPSDCPPVRLIAHYGFVVRCPGLVVARQLGEPRRERRFTDDSASFGLAELSGDHWPHSDSDRIASWIAGSRYIKLQTGITVYYPTTTSLYQGPIPNASLCEGAVPGVMSGIEYPVKSRTVVIAETRYCSANLNIICALPPHGEELVVERGRPLAVFYPVFRKASISLRSLAGERVSAVEEVTK